MHRLGVGRDNGTTVGDGSPCRVSNPAVAAAVVVSDRDEACVCGNMFPSSLLQANECSPCGGGSCELVNGVYKHQTDDYNGRPTSATKNPETRVVTALSRLWYNDEEWRIGRPLTTNTNRLNHFVLTRLTLPRSPHRNSDDYYYVCKDASVDPMKTVSPYYRRSYYHSTETHPASREPAPRLMSSATPAPAPMAAAATSVSDGSYSTKLGEPYPAAGSVHLWWSTSDEAPSVVIQKSACVDWAGGAPVFRALVEERRIITRKLHLGWLFRSSRT